MAPINADTVPIRPVLSLVSKGRTGTGKTIASCGKEFRPVRVLDCEGRMDSVISYYRKLDGHARDIYFDSFHMNTGFYELDKTMDEIIARPEWKTIVVASLTSYIHIVLKHLINTKVGQKRKSGQDAGKRIGGIPVNELEDYNAEDAAIIYELIAFMQQIKNQGTNVILEAHISPYEITTIDEDSRSRQQQTIMQILTKGKKAPAQIPGYFNEVYLFEKKFEGIQAGASEAHYYVNTVGSQVDECKTSMGIKPFDWTGKDFSIELWNQLSQEVKDTPRVDPNAPKAVRF